jgi:hypothetical protein
MTVATFGFDYELPYANWYVEIGPPLLQVAIGANDEEIRLHACADTGSFAIIADAALLEPLKLDVYSGRRTTVTGTIGPTGQPITGWIHSLVLTVEALDFQAIADVVVVPNYNCPYLLLGREGFLNRWLACFRDLYQTMYFTLDGRG